MSKLLVVDDEEAICWGVERLGRKMGHEVASAASAERAFELVQYDPPDAIVLDVRLPGLDGLAAMQRLRAYAGNVPMIVITAYGDLTTAVEAVRNGAFEYIVKPFDLQRLREALERALTREQPTEPASPPVPVVEGFVAMTPIMQEVFSRLALAAASDAFVLLQGESGTGKELAARAIHRYSRRCDGPFVVVNVAALSETLADSELFGHVRGAFTGAEQSRSGLLAQAHRGTLFLDEVAEIPPTTQVKLLRALEQREVLPVGSDEPVPTDFRLVSATHQDLPRLIRAGTFRPDLYFRIAAFPIELPPLRQRRDDIVPLAEHFLRVLADHKDQPARLSASSRESLCQREWLGNVRELRNAMEHARIVSRGGLIEPAHLPEPAVAPGLTDSEAQLEDRIAALLAEWTEQRLSDSRSDGRLYAELLELVEPPVIARILARHADQLVASARVLGLHRTTLRKKVEQHRLGD